MSDSNLFLLFSLNDVLKPVEKSEKRHNLGSRQCVWFFSTQFIMSGPLRYILWPLSTPRLEKRVSAWKALISKSNFLISSCLQICSLWIFCPLSSRGTLPNLCQGCTWSRQERWGGYTYQALTPPWAFPPLSCWSTATSSPKSSPLLWH